MNLAICMASGAILTAILQELRGRDVTIGTLALGIALGAIVCAIIQCAQGVS